MRWRVGGGDLASFGQCDVSLRALWEGRHWEGNISGSACASEEYEHLFAKTVCAVSSSSYDDCSRLLLFLVPFSSIRSV